MKRSIFYDVYFDGVHMDTFALGKSYSDEEVNTILTDIINNGFSEYNGSVKEDWLRSGGRPNPVLTIKRN